MRAFSPAMNAADTVLWAVERDPELRSTVTAVALLDRPPDRDRLAQRVNAAVVAFPRLRQRVHELPFGVGRPRWEDDPRMDLAFHLRTVRAADPELRWLLDFAASLAAVGLDRSRPLWELVVVEGLPGDTAALVIKMHHSMTDGVGGMEWLMALLDWTRHPRSEPSLDPVPPARASRPWIRGAQLATDGLGWLGPALFRSALRPDQTVVTAWRTGQSLARLMAPAGRRRSTLLVGHGTNWRFDVLERPLPALQDAAPAAGGTINDVFVAAVAGGLHRYHMKHGSDAHELRLNLPVSVRRPGDPPGGNRFTPVRFVLPVSEPDAASRIEQVGAACRRWRNEPAVPLSEAIAGVISLLPPQATTAIMGSLLRGVDFVATNVPGSPQRCYLGGAAILREFAFAPLSGAAVNVALVSHVGTACIGVNTDRAAVADPDVLMACLADGFDEVTAVPR